MLCPLFIWYRDRSPEKNYFQLMKFGQRKTFLTFRAYEKLYYTENCKLTSKKVSACHFFKHSKKLEERSSLRSLFCVIVHAVMGYECKPVHDIINRIPLSNNTIQGRMDEIGRDAENISCR